MTAERVFFEVFDGLDRQAPGSEASTLRALDVVRRVSEPERILDAGCGTGASTLVLLRHTNARVVAVDVHAPSLDTLCTRAVATGGASRLETRVESIGELDDAPGSFDVVWSEGAIYTIGFDNGLTSWFPLLQPGGVLACSELCWLKADPSARAREYMGREYPAIRSIAANVAAGEAAGYRLIEHFALPETDWLDSYYAPVARRVGEVRTRHPNDPVADEVLRSIDEEIETYRDCSSDYGYVFYVFQRD